MENHWTIVRMVSES